MNIIHDIQIRIQKGTFCPSPAYLANLKGNGAKTQLFLADGLRWSVIEIDKINSFPISHPLARKNWVNQPRAKNVSSCHTRTAFFVQVFGWLFTIRQHFFNGYLRNYRIVDSFLQPTLKTALTHKWPCLNAKGQLWNGIPCFLQILILHRRVCGGLSGCKCQIRNVLLREWTWTLWPLCTYPQLNQIHMPRS